ncbi:MAG: hypothetical protein ABFD25_20675 [Clostridiaceae bacterium]
MCSGITRNCIGITLAILITLLGITAYSRYKKDIDANSSIINQKQGISDAKIDETQKSSIIYTEDFYEAISLKDKELSEDERLKQILSGSQDILSRQILVNGETNYIISWVNYLGNAGVFVVFKVEKDEKTPIFLSRVSRIVSVKLIETTLDNIALVEVVTYFGSGSFSSQKVKIFSLSEEVKEVWTYETIAAYPLHNIDSSGEGEKTSVYSSYLIIPSYQLTFESKDPAIYVNENTETVKIKNDKEISRQINSKNKVFIWDQNAFKFVEQKE